MVYKASKSTDSHPAWPRCTTEYNAKVIITLLNKLPFSGKNSGLWNHALKIAGSDFWLHCCKEWSKILRETHFLKTNTDVLVSVTGLSSKTGVDHAQAMEKYDREALYEQVVRTLRELRAICKSIYTEASWRTAVKVWMDSFLSIDIDLQVSLGIWSCSSHKYVV